MERLPSTLSGRCFTEINEYLRKIERVEVEEKHHIEDLASIIAFQHNLCNKIDSSAAGLMKQAHHKATSVKKGGQLVLKYRDKVKMPRTAKCLEIEESIASELWQLVDNGSQVQNQFQRSHERFLEMICKRNESLIKNYAQAQHTPNVKFMDGKTTQPKEPKKMQIVKDIEARLPNAINKTERITEFNPTNRYIQEIDEQLNGSYSEKDLENYYEELKRTEKELLNSFLEEIDEADEAERSFKCPSYEILRRSKKYQQMLSVVSHNSIYLRNGILDYHKEMNTLINKFKETQNKLMDCFAYSKISQEKKEEMYQNDLRSLYNHRKILFLKSIFSNKSLFSPPPKWSSYDFVKSEVIFLKKLQEFLSENKYTESLQLIESNLERYSDSTKQIQEELNQTNECIAKALKAKNDWARREMVRVDHKLQARAQTIREDVEMLYNEIQNNEQEARIQITDSLNNLNNFIQNYKYSNFIPLDFEQIMSDLILKESKKEWLHERIENMKKEVQYQEDTNSSLRSTLQHIKDKIVEKQKQFKGLQSHEETDDEDDEYNHLKEMYFCSCGENPRDSIITKCGHTFCHECIMERVHSRLRKCNYCNQPFNCNSEIFKIRWQLSSDD